MHTIKTNFASVSTSFFAVVAGGYLGVQIAHGLATPIL